MRLARFALIVLTLLVWCARGQAQDRARYDLRVAFGMEALSTESGGFGIHPQVLLRALYFGLGVSAQVHSWLVPTSLGGSVDAGIVLPFERVRVELLGRIGGTRHFGIDGVAFDSDGGVDVTLPFAGAQLNLFYVHRFRTPRALLVGVSALIERDLRQRTLSYQYDACGWLDDCTDLVSETVEVGWLRAGAALLAVGMQFDLPRRRTR